MSDDQSEGEWDALPLGVVPVFAPIDKTMSSNTAVPKADSSLPAPQGAALVDASMITDFDVGTEEEDAEFLPSPWDCSPPLLCLRLSSTVQALRSSEDILRVSHDDADTLWEDATRLLECMLRTLCPPATLSIQRKTDVVPLSRVYEHFERRLEERSEQTVAWMLQFSSQGSDSEGHKKTGGAVRICEWTVEGIADRPLDLVRWCVATEELLLSRVAVTCTTDTVTSTIEDAVSPRSSDPSCAESIVGVVPHPAGLCLSSNKQQQVLKYIADIWSTLQPTYIQEDASEIYCTLVSYIVEAQRDILWKLGALRALKSMCFETTTVNHSDAEDVAAEISEKLTPLPDHKIKQACLPSDWRSMSTFELAANPLILLLWGALSRNVEREEPMLSIQEFAAELLATPTCTSTYTAMEVLNTWFSDAHTDETSMSSAAAAEDVVTATIDSVEKPKPASSKAVNSTSIHSMQAMSALLMQNMSFS